MGKLTVTLGVGDQQGSRFEDIEATVDTGATFTAIPRALLQRLGVPVDALGPVPPGRSAAPPRWT